MNLKVDGQLPPALRVTVCSSVTRFVLTRPWFLPLVLSLALSIILIERKYGLYSASFLADRVLQWFELPLFMFGATAIDYAALQVLLLSLILIDRVFQQDPRKFALRYIGIASACVIAINVVQYNIISYLGDITRVRSATAIGNGVGGALPFVLDLLPGFLIPWTLIALAWSCGYIAAGMLTRRVQNVPRQRIKSAWKGCACSLLLLLAVEVAITFTPATNAITSNLRRSSLYQVIHPIVRTLTDFDGDGYGLLDTPPDFAPFDQARHPFAVQMPGSGIDANGLGVPLKKFEAPDVESTVKKPLSHPDILLIVPCSLRADVVFGGALGPGVMPTCLTLAKHGFTIDDAFSHTGYTISSLQAIFCGNLSGRRRSLIQDLKANNYQVGVFSVQDDRFGDVRRICAFEDADCYFDATKDPDARVTSFSAPSSMILPGARIIHEAHRYLQKADSKAPLFLYAHFETTHYPYTHDSPRDLVPHSTLSPRAFSRANREQIIALYRNAAANLDQQIAELVNTFRENRKTEPVIIMVADHGESLFDDGMLGHGLVLNDVQTRIPLIIANGWGRLPVPFGHYDLRPFILDMLATEPPPTRVISTREPNKSLFQYTGTIMRPHEIGAVSKTGRVVVDLDERIYTAPDNTTVPLSALPSESLARDLIRRWECYQLVESGTPVANGPK